MLCSPLFTVAILLAEDPFISRSILTLILDNCFLIDEAIDLVLVGPLKLICAVKLNAAAIYNYSSIILMK